MKQSSEYFLHVCLIFVVVFLCVFIDRTDGDAIKKGEEREEDMHQMVAGWNRTWASAKDSWYAVVHWTLPGELWGTPPGLYSNPIFTCFMFIHSLWTPSACLAELLPVSLPVHHSLLSACALPWNQLSRSLFLRLSNESSFKLVPSVYLSPVLGCGISSPSQKTCYFQWSTVIIKLIECRHLFSRHNVLGYFLINTQTDVMSETFGLVL